MGCTERMKKNMTERVMIFDSAQRAVLWGLYMYGRADLAIGIDDRKLSLGEMLENKRVIEDENRIMQDFKGTMRKMRVFRFKDVGGNEIRIGTSNIKESDWDLWAIDDEGMARRIRV